MSGLWSVLTSHFNSRKESDGGYGSIPDNSILELDPDSILQLTRQTMALARRRRCATEQLDGDLTSERSILFALGSWYLKNGLTRDDMAPAILTDLTAVYNSPDQISYVLKKRILLTRYYSKTGEPEDCYHYGNIDPFAFQSGGAIPVGLRSTFHDVMPFAQRIGTIISFDPETRGFKHQIRYFRTLLAAYGMAHLLTMEGIKDPVVDAVHADERAFAKGWLSLAKKMEELSINPFDQPPDENLLYKKSKVAESAMLFNTYVDYSKELLDSRR